VLSKGKAAAAWPFSLIREEASKLFRDARQTKARIEERPRSLAKSAGESADVGRKRGSARDRREHDHREYFSNLIAESRKRSGLGPS
jgi:hypothetical protein